MDTLTKIYIFRDLIINQVGDYTNTILSHFSQTQKNNLSKKIQYDNNEPNLTDVLNLKLGLYMGVFEDFKNFIKNNKNPQKNSNLNTFNNLINLVSDNPNILDKISKELEKYLDKLKDDERFEINEFFTSLFGDTLYFWEHILSDRLPKKEFTKFLDKYTENRLIFNCSDIIYNTPNFNLFLNKYNQDKLSDISTLLTSTYILGIKQTSNSNNKDKANNRYVYITEEDQIDQLKVFGLLNLLLSYLEDPDLNKKIVLSIFSNFIDNKDEFVNKENWKFTTTYLFIQQINVLREIDIILDNLNFKSGEKNTNFISLYDVLFKTRLPELIRIDFLITQLYTLSTLTRGSDFNSEERNNTQTQFYNIITEIRDLLKENLNNIISKEIYTNNNELKIEVIKVNYEELESLLDDYKIILSKINVYNGLVNLRNILKEKLSNIISNKIRVIFSYILDLEIGNNVSQELPLSETNLKILEKYNSVIEEIRKFGLIISNSYFNIYNISNIELEIWRMLKSQIETYLRWKYKNDDVYGLYLFSNPFYRFKIDRDNLRDLHEEFINYITQYKQTLDDELKSLETRYINLIKGKNEYNTMDLNNKLSEIETEIRDKKQLLEKLYNLLNNHKNNLLSYETFENYITSFVREEFTEIFKIHHLLFSEILFWILTIKEFGYDFTLTFFINYYLNLFKFVKNQDINIDFLYKAIFIFLDRFIFKERPNYYKLGLHKHKIDFYGDYENENINLLPNNQTNISFFKRTLVEFQEMLDETFSEIIEIYLKTHQYTTYNENLITDIDMDDNTDTLLVIEDLDYEDNEDYLLEHSSNDNNNINNISSNKGIGEEINLLYDLFSSNIVNKHLLENSFYLNYYLGVKNGFDLVALFEDLYNTFLNLSFLDDDENVDIDNNPMFHILSNIGIEFDYVVISKTFNNPKIEKNLPPILTISFDNTDNTFRLHFLTKEFLTNLTNNTKNKKNSLNIDNEKMNPNYNSYYSKKLYKFFQNYLNKLLSTLSIS